MATLLKWAQNTTQGKHGSKHNHSSSNNNTSNINSSTSSSSTSTNGEKKWIHPAEALQKGHIAYLVKFLGNTIVDQPKGIEVVKEAIRKLRFTQQLKKSESGSKTRKVELTISADGVAIQEPRTHNIMHQFPLHRISYCADDKGEKKFFSFITKKQLNNQEADQDDKHECFVFISDKLAEEITLTIGQAFELAYKRFLESSGKDLESQRRAMVTQQKIKRLQHENDVYRQRLLDLSRFPALRADLDQYLRRQRLATLLDVPSTGEPAATNDAPTPSFNGSHHTEAAAGNGQLLDLSPASDATNGNAPPVPPRQSLLDYGPTVGTKLEGLLLNEFDQLGDDGIEEAGEEDDDDFDPRSYEHRAVPKPSNGANPAAPTSFSPAPPLLAPPPKAARRANFAAANSNNNTGVNSSNNNGENVGSRTFGQDLFGVAPFASSQTAVTPTANSARATTADPFEMGADFGTAATPQDIENAIGLLDKRILEMKTGFSRGISFGNEDFSLESLDPLRN